MRHVDELLAELYTPWLALVKESRYENHEC